MALIIDFLLLAASGAACFYCWILSARIKSLTSSENGIQSGIAALSQSAEDIQSAMSTAKDDATQKSETLEALIGEADKKIPEIRDLLEQINELTQRSVSEVETATTNLVGTLAPHIEEARTVSHELLDSLETASENNDRASGPATRARRSEDAPNSSDNEEESFEIELSAVVDEDSHLKEGEAA